VVRRVVISKNLSIIVLLIIVIGLSGCGAGGENGTSSPQSSASTVATTYCNNATGVSSGISIAWDLPTEYSNNTPLFSSDIDGFRIYFGTESKRYTNVIGINDPNITSCSLPVSTSEIFYITMTVVTKDGLESAYSNEISRTI